MESLEYSHVIPHLRQISRACKTGRTGTDDSHFVAVHLLCSYRLNIIFKRIVGHEPLELTDGYRLAFDSAMHFPSH